MAKFIELGEHKWQLPKEPTTQDEVLFVKNKKEDQCWRRLNDLPKFFYDWDFETRLFADHTKYDELGQLTSLDRQDSKKFLYYRDREMRRRCEGVWFMNNGELTYLTGGHYFFLQWAQMAGGNDESGGSYGNYRRFQAKLSYFMQMIKEDENCPGAYIVKNKKSGVTQFFASDFYEESTRFTGKWFGIMSKTQIEDARDNNFMMYKHILENCPNVFKPSIANENLTMIFYGNPVNNKNSAKKSRNRSYGNLQWLNTRVSVLPTKANAFDGGKPFRAWLDEFPKYIAPYPQDVYAKTLPTVQMGRRVTGKMWFTSYNPESDDRSFEEAKIIFYESLLETLNPKTGRTKSELKAYFISALEACEGAFDRYGNSVEYLARDFIQAKKDQKKGDRAAIQALERQMPTTIDEAWRSGGMGGSVFNNARLNAKELLIRRELSLGNRRFKECNLEWDGKFQASAVRIDEVTEKDAVDNGRFGLWRMWGMEYWRMDALNRPFRNNIRDLNGLLLPDKDVRFVIGMDPTDYKHGNDVIAGSKNSMWVWALPDTVLNSAFRKQVSDRPIASYFYRHDRPSDTYNDIKKAIYLWGCPIIIEGNMGTWLSMLVEDGLENFILVRDTKTKAIVPYNATEHRQLLTTQGTKDTGTINELLKVAQEYLAQPSSETEFDNLNNINCEILLKQLQSLNPKDTKKSDHAMGFLWTLLAARSMDAYVRRMLEILNDYSKEAMCSALDCLDEWQ